MNYIKLLIDGFSADKLFHENVESRFEYLSNEIFNFCTYDSEMDELFVLKAIEVCKAITDSKTFEYITDKENYKWYLLMCNMPFFSERIEWGGSVRGAWWKSGGFTFQSCGLFDGDEQIRDEIKFDVDEWKKFIGSIVEFANDGEA